MQILRLHDLTAVNTFFQPRHGKEVHTFLHTAPKGDGGYNAADNDFGEYVGALCKAKYKGKQFNGRVKAVLGGKKSKKWLIRFDDGYNLRCGPKTLKKLLVKSKKARLGKQLDYILVSTRWRRALA